MRHRPRLLLRLLAAAAVAVAGAPIAAGRGGGPPPGPFPGPKEDPVGVALPESRTVVSVPLDDTTSVVLPLPERFWVQCPRVSPNASCLDGVGTIVQYMNARSGTVSMLYVGWVPLGPSLDGDGVDARAARTALDFTATLAEKYSRVDWALTSGPVATAPAPVKVDGKKANGWRTKAYRSKPAGAYGGPRSEFTGECVLFVPAGREQLVYVALDAKAGGTTLDKAIEALSVRPTKDVNPAGRRVQLNDLRQSESNPSRFPVRQIAFDVPAGFVRTPKAEALQGEWVWAEERLDPTGRAVAALRIQQREVDPTRTLVQDRDDEMGLWKEAERGPAVEAPLAAKGQVAWVYEHPSPRDGPTARAHTAVLRVDDQVFFVSWATFGDAAALAADRAALLALLHSLAWVARW